MPSTSITLGDQATGQVIEWSIVRATERAQCLATPGGELWVSKALWQHRPQVSDAAGLAALLEVIEAAASMQNDARVAVGRLGPGPTQLNSASASRSSAEAIPRSGAARRSCRSLCFGMKTDS